MAEPARLSEVRKRTLRLTLFEDGSWDLMLGVIFLMLAIYPVTRARLGPAWNLALFVGLLLIIVAAQWFVRQRISSPRLGYAKPRRSPWLKPILVITVSLVVLTFGLVILTLVSPAPEAAPTEPRSYWVEVVAMLALVGLFSGMGYLVGVPRLFLYGWLVGGGNLASVVLNQGAPERLLLPLALAAAIILAIGASLLIRFVRKYPTQALEA
jgi:hypothetical protein